MDRAIISGELADKVVATKKAAATTAKGGRARQPSPPPFPDDHGRRREAQRAENRRIGDGDEFNALPELVDLKGMIERFVFLSDGSRVFDTLNPGHELTFLDFRNSTKASKTEDGEKEKATAQLWLASARRMTAHCTTFKAGGKRFVNDPNGRQAVNLWVGYLRKFAGAAGDPQLFLDHVRFLFSDRADDFLDWLAHIEQAPGVLPHTAWVHISSHTGTGRNALAGILARVWAGHVAVALDLVAMLDSGFNEALSRKVLAVVDEIKVGGSANKWEHAEALKQTITAAERRINPKYGRESIEFNSCRFLLFSNHRSAVPIDDTDRRFEVVISDEPPLSPDYYEELYAAIADPAFIAGVVAFLSSRDISKFKPGRRSKATPDREQVVAVSRSDELTDLMEWTRGYAFDLASSELLCTVAGIGGGIDQRSTTKLSHLFNSAGWAKLARVQIEGKRRTVYVRRELYSKWSAPSADVRSGLAPDDGGATVPRYDTV